MYSVVIEGKISEVREVAQMFGLEERKNMAGFKYYAGLVSDESEIRESLKGVEYREWFQYGPEKVWVTIVPTDNILDTFAQKFEVSPSKLEQLAFQLDGKELKPAMFSSEEKYQLFAQFMSEWNS